MSAIYAWECRLRRWFRCLGSFRITQWNKRAFRPGRGLRVASTVNNAPFKPNQQIPMVLRTDIRWTPAPTLEDND